jgi:hypothetical protein
MSFKYKYKKVIKMSNDTIEPKVEDTSSSSIETLDEEIVEPNKPKEPSGLNWFKVFQLKGLRDENGRANLDAVLELITEEGKAHISNNEIDPTMILEALNIVVEKDKSKKDVQYKIGTLPLRIFQEMKNLPNGAEDFALERITSFLRQQSELFKQGKQAACHITNGRSSGGVHIVDENYTKEYWAKQAKKQAK